MFHVDEGCRAAEFLRFGDGVQRERRLSARFRTVDLRDATAREPADAEREIDRDRARRDDVKGHPFAELTHPHDRAFAELSLDLREGVIEGGLPFVLRCHVDLLFLSKLCYFSITI